MVGTVAHSNHFQHFIDPGFGVLKAEQPTVIDQVLSAGQVVVEEAAVANDSNTPPNLLGAGAQIVAGHRN